jgi:hypothetical protein
MVTGGLTTVELFGAHTLTPRVLTVKDDSLPPLAVHHHEDGPVQAQVTDMGHVAGGGPAVEPGPVHEAVPVVGIDGEVADIE